MRSCTIELPDAWDYHGQAEETRIIKLLLNHEASTRPTSDQLLEFLPLPESQGRDMISMVEQTMKSPQSRDFKNLMKVIGHPAGSEATNSSFKESGKEIVQHCMDTQRLMDKSRQKLELHGVIFYDAPMLPSDLLDEKEPLPDGLRIRLAGSLADTNINRLKRYAFGRRVMNQMRATHILESMECAVDIVTPNEEGIVLADAEVMVLCQEIIFSSQADPEIMKDKLFLRISHHHLLTGILQHFGLRREIQETVIKGMRKWETLPERASGMVESFLKEMGVSEKICSKLAPLLKPQNDLMQFSKDLRVVKGVTANQMIASRPE